MISLDTPNTSKASKVQLAWLVYCIALYSSKGYISNPTGIHSVTRFKLQVRKRDDVPSDERTAENNYNQHKTKCVSEICNIHENLKFPIEQV